MFVCHFVLVEGGTVVQKQNLANINIVDLQASRCWIWTKATVVVERRRYR